MRVSKNCEILLLLLIGMVHSYKILVYNNRFCHSHMKALLNIADVLAEAGHDVTTLMIQLDPQLTNLTTLSNVVHVEREPEAQRLQEETTMDATDVFATHRKGVWFSLRAASGQASVFSHQCRKTVKTPGLIEQLHEEHYDVYIAETFDYCGIGLAHLIAPKALITTSSTSLFDITSLQLGVPVAPNYFPEFAGMRPHSLWDRIKNLDWFLGSTAFMYIYQYHCEQEFRQIFGSSFPAFSDLIADSAYHFTDSEPLLELARPTLRKVIAIGGLGTKEPAPLTKHWNDILSRKPQTVLITFGSIIKSAKMKIEYKRAILKAISNFPDVTFIWKYENLTDSFVVNETSKVPNAVLDTWIPQNDLLADSRVVGIVSHAGMASTQEISARGVPALIVPLYADQHKNAAMLENLGMAVVFEKSDIGNVDKLVAHLSKLLNTKNLRESAQRVSRVLRSRPHSPHDELVRHVELAAEFGALPNLKPRGLELSFTSYFFIDLIGILFVVVTFVLFFTFVVVRRVVTKIISGSTKLKSS